MYKREITPFPQPSDIVTVIKPEEGNSADLILLVFCFLVRHGERLRFLVYIGSGVILQCSLPAAMNEIQCSLPFTSFLVDATENMAYVCAVHLKQKLEIVNGPRRRTVAPAIGKPKKTIRTLCIDFIVGRRLHLAAQCVQYT